MRTAPGPTVHPLLKVLPHKVVDAVLGRGFLRDPLGYLRDAVHQYGHIVAVSPGRVFLVNHPDYVQHVLQQNNQNYIKGPRMTNMLKPFFGQGLLTAEGPRWLRQRRLAQPAFARRLSPELHHFMVSTTSSWVERWQTTATEFREFREDLTELTLDILLKGVLGTDWGENPQALLKAVTELEQALSLVVSYVDPFHAPLWVPTPNNLRVKRALREADHWMYRLIAARRQNARPGNDLLSLFIAARDPDTGESMDDRQLRDELLTLLRTGHSTIRECVLWSWYLLASHPEVERRFYDEVDTVLGGRPPTFEDLSRLTYTLQVIQESMRLYPPAWVFVRAAIEDDEIGGCHVPAGAMVVMCPFVTHRHADFWKEPETFDPDRFSPERSDEHEKFAYYPFGGGPRLCIGNNFAFMEAQTILAMTAQRFRLELDKGHQVRIALYISLMAHNLHLRMIARR